LRLLVGSDSLLDLFFDVIATRNCIFSLIFLSESFFSFDGCQKKASP